MHIKHFLAIGVALIGVAAMPSFAAEATLKGAFALPGIAEKVSAELAVRETGPLTRELLIAFIDKLMLSFRIPLCTLFVLQPQSLSSMLRRVIDKQPRQSAPRKVAFCANWRIP